MGIEREAMAEAPPSATLVERLTGTTTTPDTAALDGLRAVAVLLTMGFHIVELTLSQSKDSGRFATLQQFRPVTDFGQTGVELFFVLSGFLLFIPYVRAMLNASPLPSPRKFFVRRALRILPAYWVSLTLFVLFIEPQFQAPDQRLNLTLHYLLLHDSAKETLRSINAPYWTMAVEVHYYLLLPLLGAAIWGAGRKGQAWLGAAGLLALVALSPIYFNQLRTPYPPPSDTVVRVFYVAGFLVVFAVGMAISWFYVAYRAGRLAIDPALVQRGSKLAGVWGILILATYAAFSLALSVTHPAVMEFNRIWREWPLAAAYGGILLGTLFGWPLWRRVLTSPPLRFIGIISYSLYIWNEVAYRRLIVPLALNIGDDRLALLVMVLLSPLIVAFAFGFYTLVERPFMGLRRRQH